jgi:hypothetical protein
MPLSRDEKYLNLILDPIRVCKEYKPKFGGGAKGSGLTYSDFNLLYGNDPFYSWLGLNHPLMYSAHKAAGGMTSLYRQIGIGCEKLFREILKDELGLTEQQVKWSYQIPAANNKTRTLSLDGRIRISDLRDDIDKRRVKKWILEICENIQVDTNIANSLQGIVFEVRQGYKSKDSKRQNADIANKTKAYSQGYLPCAIILSMQIDDDIITRYRAAQWAILTGKIAQATQYNSSFSFMNEIIGFNLAAFFEGHKDIIREEVIDVLETLISAE